MEKQPIVKQRTFDAVFDIVLKHPFIFVALFCLLLIPMGFAQVNHVDSDGILAEAVIFVIAAAALFLLGRPSKSLKVNIYLAAMSAAVIIVYSLLVDDNHNNALMMFVPALIIIIQLAVVMYFEKSLSVDRAVFLMIIIGVVLRYCYCLKYSSTEMQHDIGSFSGQHGHLSYINYWYENGLSLPDFDITTRWQFYHPPLHHMLMALGMDIFTFLGLDERWAQEAIQILPMIYSALSMVVCCRIFKLVKLDGAGLVAAMAVPCFYRTFIIFGGAYNNDMLCTLFMLLAMLWTVKWYYRQTVLYILPIALCVGLGMMTKLSAWMVAPAIALVFVWVFIKNIRKPLRYIGQYAAFGGVCAPLGLWWGIRNAIEQGISITFVPDVKMTRMSVEQIPAMQRLFDFDVSQFNYPFAAFTMYNAPYDEYNPIIALFKTSLFDEYYKEGDGFGVETALVVFAAMLAIIGLIGLIYFICKKSNGVDLPIKLFFALIFVTILVSYILFCFQFPYVCTENIRYCIPVIPILAMGMGFLLNAVIGKLKKAGESK